MRAVQLLALCVAGVAAYEVSFKKPVRVGMSKEGSRYWRPRGGVGFGRGRAAFTVQTRGDGCRCGEDGEAQVHPECKHGCGGADVTVFTVDGGESFAEHTGEGVFCGQKSIEEKEGEEVVRACPDESRQAVSGEGNDVVTMPVFNWKVTGGGLLSSAGLSATRSEKVFTIKAPRPQVLSVSLGQNAIVIDDKSYRLATTRYDNDTVTSVITSPDGGYTWTHAGALPIVVTAKNTLERMGHNEFRVQTKVTDPETGLTKVLSVSSKTRGRKWDKATKEEGEVQSLQTVAVTNFVYFISGGRASPYAVSISGKKEKPKFFNLVDEHNIAKADDQFSDTYRNSIAQAQGASTKCRVHPYPEDGSCESSGLVDTINLGPSAADGNFTELLMCYDRVNGWGGPTTDFKDSVYCMKAMVNETKEHQAAEAKRKKEEERAKARLEREEAMRKADEERRQRKKKEQREKNRKLREQRKVWNAIDVEEYIEPAREAEKIDGELIIVRDPEKHAQYQQFMEEQISVPDERQVVEIKEAYRRYLQKQKEEEEAAAKAAIEAALAKAKLDAEMKKAAEEAEKKKADEEAEKKAEEAKKEEPSE